MLKNESGASAVEYGLLVALVAIAVIGAVITLGSYFSKKTIENITAEPIAFNESEYEIVPLPKLNEHTEGKKKTKLRTEGYLTQIIDPRTGQPLFHGGHFFYVLRERQYEFMGKKNHEFLLMSREKNLPFRIRVWGVLEDCLLVGRRDILEVQRHQPWKYDGK